MNLKIPYPTLCFFGLMLMGFNGLNVHDFLLSAYNFNVFILYTTRVLEPCLSLINKMIDYLSEKVSLGV